MFACFWFRFEVGEWAEVMIREGFESAAVYGAAALFAAFAADREAALDLAARGISFAPDPHDPETSQCLHARLTAWSVTPGGASQAFEVAQQLVDTSERRPPAHRFWRAYARLVAAWMHSNLHPGRASDLLSDALALAAPLGNEVLDGYAQLVAGHLVSASGRKIEAMAHFDALAHYAETVGSPHLAVMAPWSVAHVAHALGDDQTAIDAYRSSLRWLYEVRDWVHMWAVVELLCAWAARRGDRELAAVILGHLDAHRIAMSGYQRGRRRTALLLPEVSTTSAAMALGQRLTRDQLAEHILERL
jgi:hypothetical protein